VWRNRRAETAPRAGRFDYLIVDAMFGDRLEPLPLSGIRTWKRRAGPTNVGAQPLSSRWISLPTGSWDAVLRHLWSADVAWACLRAGDP